MQVSRCLQTLLLNRVSPALAGCSTKHSQLLSNLSYSTETPAEPPNEQATESASNLLPKLVVFGGRGFVGSHIVQEAVSQGFQVVAISRSGTPPVKREAWTEQVDWVRGDALDPRSYEEQLQGAVGAISAVGAFGSQKQMLKLNGTANVHAIEAAALAGIPRFAFISAQIPPIPGIEFLLRGYVQGKREAEEALKKHFPTGGVALRPSVVYGNRVVSASMTIPLQYLFMPMEMMLAKAPTRQLSQIPFIGAALTPPVSVQAVARAAVRAATDPSVAPGIMDVWEIQSYK